MDNWVIDERRTAVTMLPQASLVCLAKAAASDTEEEALSWVRPGTAMVRKFCTEANQSGILYATTKRVFDLYTERCKEVLNEFEED